MCTWLQVAGLSTFYDRLPKGRITVIPWANQTYFRFQGRQISRVLSLGVSVCLGLYSLHNILQACNIKILAISRILKEYFHNTLPLTMEYCLVFSDIGLIGIGCIKKFSSKWCIQESLFYYKINDPPWNTKGYSNSVLAGSLLWSCPQVV